MHARFTNMEAAGYLPELLNPEDPRPAGEQLAETYAHGGGWRPMPEFKPVILPDGRMKGVRYPGDPVFRVVSMSVLPKSQELLMLCEHEVLAVIPYTVETDERGLKTITHHFDRMEAARVD